MPRPESFPSNPYERLNTYVPGTLDITDLIPVNAYYYHLNFASYVREQRTRETMGRGGPVYEFLVPTDRYLASVWSMWPNNWLTKDYLNDGSAQRRLRELLVQLQQRDFLPCNMPHCGKRAHKAVLSGEMVVDWGVNFNFEDGQEDYGLCYQVTMSCKEHVKEIEHLQALKCMLNYNRRVDRWYWEQGRLNNEANADLLEERMHECGEVLQEEWLEEKMLLAYEEMHNPSGVWYWDLMESRNYA